MSPRRIRPETEATYDRDSMAINHVMCRVLWPRPATRRYADFRRERKETIERAASNSPSN
jgi:hypothetical protein